MTTPDISLAARRFYPPTESDLYHGSVNGGPYADVHRERIRAHAKHDGRGQSMERKGWDDPIWLPVVTEEVGEVARCLCDHDDKARLREELVQLAAMTTAWIDAIDQETR